MIDLHTHSIFSDGELIPAELVRRAAAIGYKAIAITDHVDQSNIDLIIPRIIKAVNALKDFVPIKIIPGVEITHVPPALIADMVKEARKLGAKIVVIHGETIVEPVAEGTNRAGIEAGADLIAHPGLISSEDLALAKKMGTVLEITARKGHSITNGHVAKKALQFGVPLTINTDAHAPSDLITKQFAASVLLGAGIDSSLIEDIFNNARSLVSKAIG
ncbi:MAG: histidinol phosphate phosphatase domain-containing protein [Nitrospirae bacterium]|nr:histidinol phosphate phosphatase domain-containing protein [Nitrospirota bacterium]